MKIIVFASLTGAAILPPTSAALVSSPNADLTHELGYQSCHPRPHSSTQLRVRPPTVPPDESYDYDELFKSDLEQNRMANNYVRFGHENWLRHRSTDRFFRNLAKPGSPIVQSLLDEFALLALLSLGIILWNELLVEGYTDLGGVHHDALLSASSVLPHFRLVLPMEPFVLCAGPLGLLLVFRNDASFQRYLEAFHHWEKIVSTFTNMMLMASTASPRNIQGVRIMGIASWALCRTLQNEVSGQFDSKEKYESDIRERFLDEEQAERLLNSHNQRLRALYDIHQSIELFTDEITVLDKRALINSVNDVANACMECERLYTTPIPLAYTRHNLKFLTFWMALLPFALYDIFADSWNHSLMIPAMGMLTFLFFGIEEIAVSLEEPFSILPMEELVDHVWESMVDVTRFMAQEEDIPTYDLRRDFPLAGKRLVRE